MLQVQYTRFKTRFSDEKWRCYLEMLPEPVRVEIQRCRRWQDRQAKLLGKLLLMEGLVGYGYSYEILNEVLIDEYGRPYLKGDIDFNISHSDEYVVCAITEGARVGIDIERIKSINVLDFDEHFSPHELRSIKLADDSYKQFFQFWTIKESVLKGNGRGLSVPLGDVHIDGKIAKISESIWYLNNLNIDAKYCCHIATSKKSFEIYKSEIQFA